MLFDCVLTFFIPLSGKFGRYEIPFVIITGLPELLLRQNIFTMLLKKKEVISTTNNKSRSTQIKDMPAWNISDMITETIPISTTIPKIVR